MIKVLEVKTKQFSTTISSAKLFLSLGNQSLSAFNRLQISVKVLSAREAISRLTAISLASVKLKSSNVNFSRLVFDPNTFVLLYQCQYTRIINSQVFLSVCYFSDVFQSIIQQLICQVVLELFLFCFFVFIFFI